MVSLHSSRSGRGRYGTQNRYGMFPHRGIPSRQFFRLAIWGILRPYTFRIRWLRRRSRHHWRGIRNFWPSASAGNAVFSPCVWSARHSLLRGILPCPAVLFAAVSGIGVQAAPAAGEAVHGAGDVGAGLAFAARLPVVGIAAVCLCAGHAGLGLFRAVSGKVSA